MAFKSISSRLYLQQLIAALSYLYLEKRNQQNRPKNQPL